MRMYSTCVRTHIRGSRFSLITNKKQIASVAFENVKLILLKRFIFIFWAASEYWFLRFHNVVKLPI